MNDADRFAKMAEIANRKRCDLWPGCCCANQFDFWTEKLNHAIGWDLYRLRVAEQSVYFMLECIAAHCPDRKIRARAERELLHPFWDRQRRGEELTEEYVRARIAQAEREGRR